MSTDDEERELEDPAEPDGASCIYYEVQGNAAFSDNYFQLCFTGGVLSTKRAY